MWYLWWIVWEGSAPSYYACTLQLRVVGIHCFDRLFWILVSSFPSVGLCLHRSLGRFSIDRSGYFFRVVLTAHPPVDQGTPVSKSRLELAYLVVLAPDSSSRSPAPAHSAPAERGGNGCYDSPLYALLSGTYLFGMTPLFCCENQIKIKINHVAWPVGWLTYADLQYPHM
jgi:hypothetical protein